MRLKLLLAALPGGAIGLERESRGRPAGLRTHILACFGPWRHSPASPKPSGSRAGRPPGVRTGARKPGHRLTPAPCLPSKGLNNLSDPGA
jgi:hypothetical protein